MTARQRKVRPQLLTAFDMIITPSGSYCFWWGSILNKSHRSLYRLTCTWAHLSVSSHLEADAEPHNLADAASLSRMQLVMSARGDATSPVCLIHIKSSLLQREGAFELSGSIRFFFTADIINIINDTSHLYCTFLYTQTHFT